MVEKNQAIYFMLCWIILGILTGQQAIFGQSASTNFASEAQFKFKGYLLNGSDSNGIDGLVSYRSQPNEQYVGIFGADERSGEFTVELYKNTYYYFRFMAEGFYPKAVMINQGMLDTLTLWRVFLQPLKEGQSVRLENLLFKRASDELLDIAMVELDNLYQFMMEYPDAIIRVEGHTDIVGDSEANKALSKKRVETVKKRLKERGIKGKRIKTKALGDTQPLIKDMDSEERYKNRRVEIRFLSL